MKIVLILIVILLSILICRYNNIESWAPYKSCPFGNWRTAPNSQVYYVQHRYRKPLYWPYKYKSSYPIDHYRHLEVY